MCNHEMIVARYYAHHWCKERSEVVEIVLDIADGESEMKILFSIAPDPNTSVDLSANFGRNRHTKCVGADLT